MAIVTTAKRADFELIHETRQIRQFMDFVLVREDYELAKPHPEPYLTGLRRFAYQAMNDVWGGGRGLVQGADVGRGRRDRLRRGGQRLHRRARLLTGSVSDQDPE